MTHQFYLKGQIKAFLISGEPIYLEGFGVDVIKPSKSRAVLKQSIIPGGDNLLLNFPDNTRIDLICKHYGKFSEYNEKEVVIRLTDCKLKYNWIPSPVTNLVDQEDLKIYALISCNIEVMNENY